MCYNKAGPTIADVLQNDQLRVVVYLYKDPNNNLRIYTPSKEKQLLLPDLSLESGDGLANVDLETLQVHRLFDSRNAVVLRKRIVGGSTIKLPNEKDLDGQSNLINSQFREDSIPEVGPFTDSKDGVVNPNVVSSAINQKDNFVKSLDTSEVDKLLLEGPESDTSLPTNPALQDEKSPIPDTQDDVPNSLLPQSKKNLKDDDKLLGESGKPLSPYKGAGHLPFAFNDDGEPVHTEEDPSVAYPDVPGIDAEYTVNEPKSLNGLYNPESNYVTFDKWFDQQMQKIQNTGKSPNKGFDRFSLKQQIEKSLYENGIYVTKDGVLIDSDGKVLDVANLKLRPILIGDSVSYDSVVSGKDKFVLPSNLPYLEAVVVTSVDPPKILGMIPLGKTYIPRVSYRRNFAYSDLKPIIRNYCTTGKCFQKHIQQAVGCKTGNCPLRYFEVQNRIHPKSSRVKKLHPQLRKLLTKIVQPQTGIERMATPHKPGQDNDLNSILKALLQLEEEKKNKKKVLVPKKKVSSSEYKGSDGYADIFEEKPSEEDNSVEEVPWFRIIGGNAATGSGTPVSSKGRSGNPYFHRHY